MREIKFRAWHKENNKTIRPGKGWYKQSGYIMQYAPYHPHCNSRGYVQEHRLIIENKLGRYLIPRKELIHHLNGIRDDNRLENLKISNPKDHAKGHIGERNKNGTFCCISKEFTEKKYRLHDKDRNITQIYTLNELISKTYRKGKFEYRGEFTGLKDKNGVEIYEGDITTNGIVVYHTKLTWDGGCIHPGFYFKGYDNTYKYENGEKCIDLNYHIHFHKLEVIGNIHLNKELLNEHI
jgi:hypothetical protein